MKEHNGIQKTSSQKELQPKKGISNTQNNANGE